MSLLQKYFWRQTLWPLLITLAALTTLAILTQSLSTLDLIVENRQSALTFFYVTLLAVPQLISIILPIAVFVAALYALNRLHSDSELTVAKSIGNSPWDLTSPLLRLGAMALIAHLIINLVIQPLSFREMRQEILSIRTDIAAQMVRAGEFVTPTPRLTFYAREIAPNGNMQDVLIRDSRGSAEPVTYVAKSALVSRSSDNPLLVLQNGIIQQEEGENIIRPVSFEQYHLNLSDIMAFDTNLRLKPSDMFLHELMGGSEFAHFGRKYMQRLNAEGHARLAAPLYNIVLILLAVAFLVRGEMQRTGLGRRIAICAAIGFGVRLIGFALASTSESTPALNVVQYVFPVIVILLCLIFIFNKNKSAGWRSLFKISFRNPKALRNRQAYANA